MSDLLQPCVSRSLLANLKTTQRTHKAGVWTQIEIADYQLVDPRVRPFKVDYGSWWQHGLMEIYTTTVYIHG